MPHIITAYWPAWLATLSGIVLTQLDIPFIGLVMVIVVSITWSLMVARVADSSATIGRAHV